MSSAAPTRVLVLGGSSEIAGAIVRRLAVEGPLRACLVGRSPDRLAAAAAALEREAGVSCSVEIADALDLPAHERAIEAGFAALGGADIVVLAVGRLGARAGLASDLEEALAVMQVSFLGAGSLLLHALQRLRTQGSGSMVVLSSVAAERPRAANAVYGAAKAGLDALAQGLADSLQGTGVRVLVVRPGFVKTRMTAGLSPAPFATTPEAVAEATAQGLAGRAHTIWVPGVLRYLFMVLRHLPRPVYRRLPL